MELTVKRQIFSDLSTIGRFFISAVFECFCLEPKDRHLKSSMTLKVIEDFKIPGVTAIPTGRYRIEKYFSPDHNSWVLRLIDVPGFGYVEIHIGNFPKDTKACLLLGTEYSPNEVLNSKIAIEAVYAKVFPVLERGEEVWITYE